MINEAIAYVLFVRRYDKLQRFPFEFNGQMTEICKSDIAF